VIATAAAERGIGPGRLTLGTDNGSAVHLARVPRPARRARDRPSSWRLPRPREPGLHRVLGSASSSSAASGANSRDPRRGPRGDRRLRRPLPPPTPQPAGLPHPARGRRHLEGSRRPANPSGLT
jgi:hypothetical protein